MIARHGSCSSRTFSRLLLAERAELRAQIGPGIGEDGHRQQAGIRCAGLADGKRAHRNAARHLHDREQRIETLQRGALHRDAEHRDDGMCGDHAGQMRGAAGARDDDFDAASFRARANSAIHTGVRCADTICRSCGTPKRSSTSTACLIVSQSDDEPMTTATSDCDIRKRRSYLRRPGGHLSSFALLPSLFSVRVQVRGAIRASAPRLEH